MTRVLTICGLLGLAGLLHPSPALGQAGGDGHLRARLFATRSHVNVGEPIWIDFQITNDSDEPDILSVHGTGPIPPDDQMGLPISHVFSGEGFGALTIRNDSNREWNIAIGYHPPAKAPYIALGPRASVGVTLDIRKYYPALRTPGDYRITWNPYGGRVRSNVLLIRVAALKQAQIMTDQGDMVLRFFYEDAPKHVENFIELARKGFYDNLTFHRIETGYFIQGGCPNGDGTGIRADGVKLESELSGRRQSRGVISMALVDDDPDSASCQFFITNTRVPDWDSRYTVFAELYGAESFETLDAIMATTTDESGIPLERLHIRGVRISDIPRDRQ